MKRILFLLLVLGIVACKDNDPVNPSQQESFKASWLNGDWHLVKGWFLNPDNGDTLITYSDETQTMHYSGGSTVQSLFVLSISFSENGDFVYDETNDHDHVLIQDSWEWLNSSQNKTHLNIVAFRSQNEPVGNFSKRAYKIISLTKTKLVIEDVIAFYHLEFERSSVCNDIGDFEVIQDIEPQAFIGSWKLGKYLQENSDGTSTWVKNDSLFHTYYNWDNNLCLIVYPYTALLSVAEKGDIKGFIDNGLTYQERQDYWYWTDATAPHKELYFIPLIHGYIINFKLDKLTSDSLVLSNTDYKVTYRFSRMN